MKWLCLILCMTALCMLSVSFTRAVSPTPKKVYKDTIYRWKTKPQSTSKTAVPVAKAPVKQPTIQKAKEENYNIRITSTITRYKVKKSEQKLYAYFGDTCKVFRISLGANPIGHKVKQGDNKTPEGTYKISFKNPKSRGYKSLKISYPNQTDRNNAQRLGVNPGGDIFIHGLWWNTQDPVNHWKDNWTRGCIALNNQQIEELYQYTEVDTEITILP